MAGLSQNNQRKRKSQYNTVIKEKKHAFET